MGTTELKFEKVGDKYAAAFYSPGRCVIQIEREKQGLVSVHANIEGMVEVPVKTFGNPFTPNNIFAVEIDEGVEVMVESATEVKKAKILGDVKTK